MVFLGKGPAVGRTRSAGMLTLGLGLAFSVGVGCVHDFGRESKGARESAGAPNRDGVRGKAAAGDCEAAAAQIGAEEIATPSVASSALMFGGTTASYGIAAIGYTADVVVISTTGVVSFVASCPLLVAEIAACSAARGICGGVSGNLCFDDPLARVPSHRRDDGSTAVGLGLGPRALDETASWRADALASAVSRDLRAVAACFARRDTADDLRQALQQLRRISEPPLDERISPGERQRVERSQARLRARLAKLDPDVGAAAGQLSLDKTPVRTTRQAREWRDLETGVIWRLQATQVISGEQALTACREIPTSGGAPWRLPNPAEVAKAVQHGFFDESANPAFVPMRHESVFLDAGDEGFVVMRLMPDGHMRDAARESRPLLCVQ